MTEQLKKAFEAAAKLPEAEQDAFANWILAELAAERRWQETWSETPDKLSDLAREARQEYREGSTEKLDLDRL